MPDKDTSTRVGMSTVDILAAELCQLENIHGQNPDTGAASPSEVSSYMTQYTHRLFGSPFQLLDSVDKRFTEINPYLGNQYLRNFTLNSPILHIKPGMPIYTGKDDSSTIFKSLEDMFSAGRAKERYASVKGFFEALAANTIFSSGDKLQKRLYGFRETFYQYMSHVNYMCRSMATFLRLTNTEEDESTPKYGTEYRKTSNFRYPTGLRMGQNNEFKSFKTMDWSNYRLLANSKALKPTEYASNLGNCTILGATVSSIINSTSSFLKEGKSSASDMANIIIAGLYGGDSSSIVDSIANRLIQSTENLASTAEENRETFNYAANNSWMGEMQDKVQSVMFMVAPVRFEEHLRNETHSSFIEETLDGLQNTVGREIAFITQTNTDIGLVDNIVGLLGDTVETAGGFLTKLTESLSGGFLSNVFHGAVRSIKGQKMIYPEIYEKSTSEMNYNYEINLSSPYGDDYNYYMEIVVPLCHLICLVAPRMVTANSTASPFLVQTWIPGQATCQLGIISEMTIVKNPNSNRVSVHGFPLDIQVQFTVKELYNAMAISPSNDPASFLYNETLNDYMANLAGLAPSVNTYSQQRANMFDNLENFFESGEYKQDVVENLVQGLENWWNPYISSGS